MKSPDDVFSSGAEPAPHAARRAAARARKLKLSPDAAARHFRLAFAGVAFAFGATLSLSIVLGVASASSGSPLGHVGMPVRAASATAPGGAPITHVPAAIYTDPPSDSAHPAKMTVLHIPSHGVEINGLVYSPPGAGAHPTLVICHGLPGNEKNLDLAQAVRRAGWNAVTFNYRGSWGSPGSFRFAQNPEDAAAVLTYLRDPAHAAALGVDPNRIAIAGHSMGGWVAALTAEHDPKLIGAAIISMGDMGQLGAALPRKELVELMADDMETLAGVTAQSMADEVQAHAKDFSTVNDAGGLAHMPFLVVTSDDGLEKYSDALLQAVRAKGGGARVTTRHFSTDHSYSDRRIALETEVIAWLATLGR